MIYRHTRRGFTLIELLVVVLIIGILAAVAVPQYQKAVLKSRYVQAKTMGTALANAMEVYYLANGEYTALVDKLDVAVDYLYTTPTGAGNSSCSETGAQCYYFTNWGYCFLGTRGDILCKTSSGNSDLTWLKFTTHSTTSDAGNSYCRAVYKATTSDITYQICQAETGSQTPQSTWPNDPTFKYTK